MGMQAQEKTINESIYTVTPFPARLGLKLKMRLIKLLGPSIAKAVTALDLNEGGSVLESELDGDLIGQAIASLTENLGDDTVDLMLDLLKSTRKNGVELNEQVFNLEFAGDYVTLYKVLYFVVEVNYGVFFGKGGIGELAEKMPMPSVVKQSIAG